MWLVEVKNLVGASPKSLTMVRAVKPLRTWLVKTTQKCVSQRDKTFTKGEYPSPKIVTGVRRSPIGRGRGGPKTKPPLGASGKLDAVLGRVVAVSVMPERSTSHPVLGMLHTIVAAMGMRDWKYCLLAGNQSLPGSSPGIPFFLAISTS